METKGERREKKRDSLRKKTSDNRKSIKLIIDLIRRKSESLKKGKKTRIKYTYSISSLQGMPSLKLSENVSHGQVYKQAGNSVSVPLVTKIARALKVALT